MIFLKFQLYTLFCHKIVYFHQKQKKNRHSLNPALLPQYTILLNFHIRVKLKITAHLPQTDHPAKLSNGTVVSASYPEIV